MYFLKNRRYKLVAKVLLFVFFVEPVLFSLSVRPVHAQNPASSQYNNAFSSYDGISQWGNLDIVNNPAIGSALRSCLNIVPSFTKKIGKIFKGKKDAASKLEGGSGSARNICATSSEAKWALGNAQGYGDDTSGYFSDDELSNCSDLQDAESGLDAAYEAFQFRPDVQQVQDATAITKLQDLRKSQAALQENIAQTKNAVDETNAKLEEERVRTECMDSIAYSMTKTLLAGVTEGTVNLINTGNFGDPFFLKDSKQYFEDLKKTSLKNVFGGLVDNLAEAGESNYPFLRTTYINLIAQNAPAPFRDRSRYTLEQILSGQPYNSQNDPGIYNTPRASGQGSLSNAFKNDFSVGGWQGWLALTQLPQNNPIGFALLAQEEFQKKQTAAEEQTKSELQQSGGFLSMKKCVEQRVPIMDGTGINATFTGRYETKTRGITVGPNDADCTKTQVVTPGTVLASRLDAVITSDVHQLELADKFNESLNTIFTAAFNKLTSEGLVGLSNKVYGSWANQATKQSFVQRYNSVLNQGAGSSNTSTVGTAELIYRRSQSSYASTDFDIATDLFDQQVGCSVRPGILTTEKNYLSELKRSNQPNLSPVYKLVPAMAELDFCIPGPTTNWEEMTDAKYSDLVNKISTSGIAFVADSEAAKANSYGDIGKMIGEIEKKRANKELAVNASAGALSTAATVLLVLPDPSLVTKIVAAGLYVAAFAVKAVHSFASRKKIEDEKKNIAMFNRMPQVLTDMIDYVFNKEAYEWGDLQLKYLEQDYKDYKDAVYKKFSDANSIPVAKDARPFVKDLPSYSKNVYDIQQDYSEEIKDQESTLAQLQVIANQTKAIIDAATARARAEEKAKGLPVGSLTEVPKECKPAPSQCPALIRLGGKYLLNGGSTTYAQLAPRPDLSAIATMGGLGTPGSGGVQFPDPEAKLNVVITKESAGTYSVYVTVDSNPTTLSLMLLNPIMTGSASGGVVFITPEEIYGLGPLDMPPQTGLAGSALLGKRFTVTGYNPNGKSVTTSCLIQNENSFVTNGNLVCK